MTNILILTILLVISGVDDISKIARANKAKSEAESFFKSGKFVQAAQKYRYLTDTLKMADDNVVLNLAHALYRSDDKSAAEKIYTSLYQSTNPTIRSIAQLQNGNIAALARNTEEALKLFKNALKSDPTNAEARYNYELLKKQQQKDDKNPNKDQQKNKDQKKDQNQKEDQKKEGDKKDQGKDNKDGKGDDKKNDKDGQGKDDKDGKGKDGKDNKGQDGKDKKDDSQANQDKKDGKGNKDGKDGKDDKKDSDKKGDKKGEGNNPDDKKGDEKKPGDQQANKPNDKLKKDDKKDGQGNANKNNGKKNNKDGVQMDAARLQQMNLTPDKANMILEAMRNTEVQYLQQMKKQPTKRIDKSKPTW